MTHESQLYLISPPKIATEIELENFVLQLEVALSAASIEFFQLRLKDIDQAQIIEVGKKLLPICKKYKTKFIINDSVDLAREIGADGVHLGSEDGNIILARKNFADNFIIGVSCYDSKKRALEAEKAGANYVSFGTFFPSQTKNSIGKPTEEILEWGRENISLPIVAIGGITDQNYKKLINGGANFVAVISYIWQNPNGIDYAINSMRN